MTHAQNLKLLRAHVAANEAEGRPSNEGLASHEIGTLNRASMFGDEGEAFPTEQEWSRIVD